ncbi:hypothetical protein K3495_g3878 [Podosphaera aphanis]|nr:hypothetical protein K3495_g3878 [Podosphaera aphanis]
MTPGGIEMDPDKLKAILEWEPPTSKRQLQRFLGFANFYRRFVKNFSELTRPLRGLTKKDAAQSSSGLLKSFPLPIKPWTDISIDYITPFPDFEVRKRRFKHIAVVVDRLTKMRLFIPTETLENEELVEAFIEKVWSLHGSPERIVSDRGTQFISAFWRALSQRLGTKLKPSSAYHSETNGQTGHINAEAEQFLRLYVNWAQDD